MNKLRCVNCGAEQTPENIEYICIALCRPGADCSEDWRQFIHQWVDPKDHLVGKKDK